MRSTIESLVKLPLLIPSETSVPSKKEANSKTSIDQAAPKNEMVENIDDVNNDLKRVEKPNHSNGYIKCPAYDFF